MLNSLRLFILILFVPKLLSAQFLPTEGEQVNYRIIGFSYPQEKNTAKKYKLEFAAGNYSSDSLFNLGIFKTEVCYKSTSILELPYFDKEYTWRVVYYNKNGSQSKSKLQHFSTGYFRGIDTCNIRLKILKPAVKYKDDYVFIDGSNVLYDMKGNPVWYLPMQKREDKSNAQIRDLKTSPQGTITFMLNQHAYEMNYNGDTLWRGPDDGAVNGEDSERYHHEMTRMSNGHYMILGTEHVFWDHVVKPVDSSFSVDGDEPKPLGTTPAQRKKTPFGTIIEYDEKGKVVWSWKSSGYFMNSDVVNFMPEGMSKVIDVHENAFFFDEKDSVIYLSFRNISRILKIKYPEGNIVNTYGEIFKPGIPPSGNGLFCDQHGIRRSKEGHLYLYNNNACNDATALPTILIMDEDKGGKDSLTKIWEYQCNIEGINVSPLLKKAWAKKQLLRQTQKELKSLKGSLLHVTTGGNVIEMPDKSIFACMNAQYGKIFIVTRDKKILWEAIPEKYNQGDDQWYITSNQYRASIITPKELHRLIYNSMNVRNQ